MEIFPSFESFIRAILSGLMMGCIFAIIAIGFQLVFGVVKIPQFAHGAFVLWGMYITWVLGEKYGVNPYLSLIITLPLFFFLGFLLQKFVIVHIMAMEESYQMIFMLGILFAIMYTAEAVFTVNPRFLGRFQYLRNPIYVGPFSFHRGLSISVLLAVVFLIFTSLFLTRSYLGKAIRAVADNPFGARIVGLKVSFLYVMAVAIASLLAGAAGTLLVTFSVITPMRAFDLTVFSFLIIALGGIGSYLGAFIGGLIFGLVFALAQGSIISTYAEAFVYGLMLFIIFLKPRGLFGKAA